MPSVKYALKPGKTDVSFYSFAKEFQKSIYQPDIGCLQLVLLCISEQTRAHRVSLRELERLAYKRKAMNVSPICRNSFEHEECERKQRIPAVPVPEKEQVESS